MPEASTSGHFSVECMSIVIFQCFQTFMKYEEMHFKRSESVRRAVGVRKERRDEAMEGGKG